MNKPNPVPASPGASAKDGNFAEAVSVMAQGEEAQRTGLEQEKNPYTLSADSNRRCLWNAGYIWAKSEAAPSPHSEDFPTVHDGYVQAAISASDLEEWTDLEKFIERMRKVADIAMKARRQATGASTPEGAAK